MGHGLLGLNSRLHYQCPSIGSSVASRFPTHDKSSMFRPANALPFAQTQQPIFSTLPPITVKWILRRD